MNDDQLRALIHDVVARHLAQAGQAPPAQPGWKAHASHVRFAVTTGQQGDGTCLIEPAVTCNHCGYCQSMGH